MFGLKMKAAHLLILLLPIISSVQGCIGKYSCSSNKNVKEKKFGKKVELRYHLYELLCSFPAIHGWDWISNTTSEVWDGSASGDGEEMIATKVKAMGILKQLQPLLYLIHGWDSDQFSKCSASEESEVQDMVTMKLNAKHHLQRLVCLFPAFHNWGLIQSEAAGEDAEIYAKKMEAIVLYTELDPLLDTIHGWDSEYFGKCSASEKSEEQDNIQSEATGEDADNIQSEATGEDADNIQALKATGENADNIQSRKATGENEDNIQSEATGEDAECSEGGNCKHPPNFKTHMDFNVKFGK